MLFDIVNLPYWIFLIMGVLLFLVITISGGDDDLDLDIDRHVDLELSHNPRGRCAVTVAERKFRVDPDSQLAWHWQSSPNFASSHRFQPLGTCGMDVQRCTF
ncbi:MAG TPA: hypothetical protein V6D11_22640 [Waterburya sp.]